MKVEIFGKQHSGKSVKLDRMGGFSGWGKGMKIRK
jgi:hypothetical protein